MLRMSGGEGIHWGNLLEAGHSPANPMPRQEQITLVWGNSAPPEMLIHEACRVWSEHWETQVPTKNRVGKAADQGLQKDEAAQASVSFTPHIGLNLVRHRGNLLLQGWSVANGAAFLPPDGSIVSMEKDSGGLSVGILPKWLDSWTPDLRPFAPEPFSQEYPRPCGARDRASPNPETEVLNYGGHWKMERASTVYIILGGFDAGNQFPYLHRLQ